MVRVAQIPVQNAYLVTRSSNANHKVIPILGEPYPININHQLEDITGHSLPTVIYDVGAAANGKTVVIRPQPADQRIISRTAPKYICAIPSV